MSSQTELPPGWDEERVERVLEHYESQTDEEAAEEDDAALVDASRTVMQVPTEFVQAVRDLITGAR